MTKIFVSTFTLILTAVSTSTSLASIMEICPDLAGQYSCVQSSQDLPDKQILMTIRQNPRSYIISDSEDAIRLMLVPAQGAKEPLSLTQTPYADCPRSPIDRGIVLRIRTLTSRNELVEQTLIPNDAGFMYRIERGIHTANRGGVIVGPKFIRRCTRQR